MEYLGHITFKGELHTIPAGAALVLKVDRHMTAAQIEALVQHCRQALGPDQRVLVIGPEVTPMALDRLPVRSMGMDPGADDDMTAVTVVSGKEYFACGGPVKAGQHAVEREGAEVFKAITDWSKVPPPDIFGTVRVNVVPPSGLYVAPAEPTPEDPMEAVRALAKKHGGGSGG